MSIEVQGFGGEIKSEGEVLTRRDGRGTRT